MEANVLTFPLQATRFGGAILVSGLTTALNISSSSLLRNQAQQGGNQLYSVAAGNLTLTNITFLMDEGGQSFISASQGSPFSEMSRLGIQCPPGHILINSTSNYVTDLEPWGLVNILAIEMECRACEKGTYSLRGSLVLPTAQQVVDMHCLDCPNGADCSLGGDAIQALSGYYCGQVRSEEIHDEEVVECVLCPEGYCSDEVRPLEAVCTENRRGVLCGECASGTSEAFGTDDCVLESKCADNTWWLITLVFIGGTIYVAVSVWLPINHHPLWKSITYFMQIVPLISSSDNILLRGTVAIFSLDVSILGLPVELCPWRGFSAVEKITSDYFLPGLLLGQLILLFCIHRLLRCCIKPGVARHSIFRLISKHEDVSTRTIASGIQHSEEEEGPSSASHSAKASEYVRYVAALTGLVLLMYEGVTSATMELLNCIEWDGDLRLAREGSIECYASWQYPLFILLGGVLVPLPFFLFVLRRWLASRHERKRLTKHRGMEWEEAVLEVLEHPYAEGRKWWESAGMLRRLTLLALATFVLDPTYKALSLTTGCLIVLLSHVYMQPFEDRYHDLAETLFLFDLVIIAILQLPLSSTVAVGHHFEASTAVSYVQEALSLLPIAFCVWVVAKHYFGPYVTPIGVKLSAWWSSSRGSRNDDGSMWPSDDGLINGDDEEESSLSSSSSSSEGMERSERRRLLPRSGGKEDEEVDDQTSYEAIRDASDEEEETDEVEAGSVGHVYLHSPSLASLIEMQESRFLRFRPTHTSHSPPPAHVDESPAP